MYTSMTSLALGATGSHRGQHFVLDGRSFVRSGRAGWNEWTMRFADRTSFLSEWGGALTLYEERALVPEFDACVPGGRAFDGWVVAERGEARRTMSWGSALGAPAHPYPFVDLSSRSGGRVTIDHGSSEPRVFVGTKVTTIELGLTATPARFFPAADVSRPRDVDLWLDIGAVGTFGGTTYRVIGVVSRSTEERWEEYALYQPDAGIRWLVVTGGHWSLANALEPGCPVNAGTSVVFDGTIHERAASGDASVVWASGELPWEVAIGDVSSVIDFTSATSPQITLTREATDGAVSWTRSEPLATDAVAKAFGTRALPRPR